MNKEGTCDFLRCITDGSSKCRECTSLSNRLARCCAHAYVYGWDMWCMCMC